MQARCNTNGSGNDHPKAVPAAREAGADVGGCFAWSLVYNYE